MKKISLITGCAGFIGSHMTDYLLQKDHVVYGIDNLASGKIKNLQNSLKNKNTSNTFISPPFLLDLQSTSYKEVFRLKMLQHKYDALYESNTFAIFYKILYYILEYYL